MTEETIKVIQRAKRDIIAHTTRQDNGTYDLRTVILKDNPASRLNLHPIHQDILRAKGFQQIDYEHYPELESQDQVNGIIDAITKRNNQYPPLDIPRMHAIIAAPPSFPFTPIPEYVNHASSTHTAYTAMIAGTMRDIADRAHLLYLGVGEHKSDTAKFPRALEMGDFKYSIAGIGVTTKGMTRDLSAYKDGRLKLVKIIQNIAKLGEEEQRKGKYSETTVKNAKELLEAIRHMENTLGKDILYKMDQILAGSEAELLYSPTLPPQRIMEVLGQQANTAKGIFDHRIAKVARRSIDEIIKATRKAEDIPDFAEIYHKIWAIDRIYAAELAARKFLEVYAKKGKVILRQYPQLQRDARLLAYFLAGVPLNAHPLSLPPRGDIVRKKDVENPFEAVLNTLHREKIFWASPLAAKADNTYVIYEQHMSTTGGLLTSDVRRINQGELTTVRSLKIGEKNRVDVVMDSAGFIYLKKGDSLVSLHHLIGKKIHSDSQREFLGLFVPDSMLSNLDHTVKTHADAYGLKIAGSERLPHSQQDIAIQAAYVMGRPYLDKIAKNVDLPVDAIKMLAEEYAKKIITTNTQELVTTITGKKRKDTNDKFEGLDDTAITTLNTAKRIRKKDLKKIADKVADKYKLDRSQKRTALAVLKDMHGVLMTAYLSQNVPVIDTNAQSKYLSEIAKIEPVTQYWQKIINHWKLIGDPTVTGKMLPVKTTIIGPVPGPKRKRGEQAMTRAKQNRLYTQILAMYAAYKREE